MSTFELSRIKIHVSVIGLLLGLGCASSQHEASTNAEPVVTDDSSLCQTAFFCDDFETAAAGSPPGGAWTTNQNAGTVSVDTTRAFRGTQSIKSSTLSTAVSGSTYKVASIGLTDPSILEAANPAFYGRMMFYLESAPAAEMHWTFVDASGPVPGQTYSATYRYGGQLPVFDGTTFIGNQLMANYETPGFYSTPPQAPNTDCYQHADGEVVPVGRWACAEWFFDGPNAQLRFWLDGTELTDLHVDRTGEGCVGQASDYNWTGPVFSRINVGWESYVSDEARSIWIDDVVMSANRVSCPAAAAEEFRPNAPVRAVSFTH